MKITTKEYIDNQFKWMVNLKERENEWIKIYLDEKDKAAREAVSIYNETMNSWKVSHNEWKSRMEQLTAQTVTRREAWIFIIAMGTFGIMLLGIMVTILIALLTKK